MCVSVQLPTRTRNAHKVTAKVWYGKTHIFVHFDQIITCKRFSRAVPDTVYTAFIRQDTNKLLPVRRHDGNISHFACEHEHPLRRTTRIPVSGRNILNASCGGRCSLRLRVVSAHNTTVLFWTSICHKMFFSSRRRQDLSLIKKATSTCSNLAWNKSKKPDGKVNRQPIHFGRSKGK